VKDFFQSPNLVLDSLPRADFNLLAPHLSTVDLEQKKLLSTTGSEFSKIYFPHSGVISLVVGLSQGEAVEVAMIGRDSVFGVSAGLGGGFALNDAIVQLSGVASIIDASHVRNAVDQSGALRTALVRNERMIFVQAQQAAACNASHTVEARLCRWLLRMRDLAGSDLLDLTQEYLAQMIGAKRNRVSQVANNLQEGGLISYKRAKIEIKDVVGLNGRSCECYRTVVEQTQAILGKSIPPRGLAAE
jgi:CRP-like cAMP-binding protein